ncbi:uncharacterized protein KY384_003991 [Bacidia gigantensis]|uniref:uncharacterized protein n=1 Tax=Bacidia gigantensis TaxID=2732470 RepID=UPI001D0515B3|nr:uncharacterized protein KY384_003991 [Bacidia gigantensis]KAG8531280.1 hypothetical protein KY384_003991 [Bacidia gigantensis]
MRFSTVVLALAAAVPSVLAAAPFPIGGEIAQITNSNGDVIMYYQGRDGDIRQRAGNGPIMAKDQYKNTQVIPKGKARANTPIAAIAYQGDITNTRIYFIDNNNFLNEIVQQNGKVTNTWSLGYGNVQNSKALAATTDGKGRIMVTFVRTENELSMAHYEGSWSWNDY